MEEFAMSEQTTANPAPGFVKRPDYRITLTPVQRRMTVRLGCVVVAESEHVLAMRETDHSPVYYFPREDVNMALLTRTAHSTYCPYKGTASYWTVAAGRRSEENAAWSYEAPYDEMARIDGYIAFYQDRVKLEVSA